MSGKKMNNIDDYFNDGRFELARQGKMVSLRNLMTHEQMSEMNKLLLVEYPSKVKEIDDLVMQIKNVVSECDPIELMRFAHSMFLLASMNKMSEIEYEKHDIASMRCAEYIQSVIVASDIHVKPDDDKREEKYHLVMKLVEDLFSLVYDFLIYWGAHAKETLNYDSDIIGYIIEATMSSLVRGKRYQFQQKRLIESLLVEQDELLKEVLRVSYSEIIKGYEKLEYSLSSANPDSMNNLVEMFDVWSEFMDTNPSEEDIEDFREEHRVENTLVLGNVFGVNLNNVKNVTDWSDHLIQQLSYKANEVNDFYDHGEFSGWPIDVLPIHRRPFIDIDGISYCFDYYSFFDNFYRMIQKSITSIDKKYAVIWAENQKRASENLVFSMFEKFLPEATIYSDNFYPKNQSLKDMAENDLIIFYDGILIIAEVKAGSFTYTTPLTDHKAHVESFINLMQKADDQCIRTRKYIEDQRDIIFYNHDKTEKFRTDKPKDIFTISITVDNMNEFQSKAEKLSLISIEQGSIFICIDDLDLYAEYFDNPLKFIHYLYQRREAAKSKLLNLNDELDHLGMYISHNMYNLYFNSEDENSKLNAYGYRENLDKYFGMLHMEGFDDIKSKKPKQKEYKYIEQIMDYLVRNRIENRVDISNFFLDLSFNAREEFDLSITRIYKRQSEIGRMLTMSIFGEAPYNVYIYQAEVPRMPRETMIDYVKSSVFKHKEARRLMLCLYLDKEMNIESIEFSFYCYSEINENEKDYLQQKSIEFTRSRAEGILRGKGIKKLGRNDPCPCGSGRKYKQCCLGKL